MVQSNFKIMDITPEEILKKHIGIAPRGNFYLIGDGVSIKEQVEKAMREYGEPKQSPRWVKAAERKPDPTKTKAVFVQFAIMKSGIKWDEHSLTWRWPNNESVTELEWKVILWLDESESPKEG